MAVTERIVVTDVFYFDLRHAKSITHRSDICKRYDIERFVFIYISPNKTASSFVYVVKSKIREFFMKKHFTFFAVLLIVSLSLIFVACNDSEK